ncbi:tandem-95 repeat protein [Roseiflexus sp.]|uniref:tandem-95 repeat protein n=2 Tax=Roseiflexus sp. TaxID=2562120 RepID=UPI00398B6012
MGVRSWKVVWVAIVVILGGLSGEAAIPTSQSVTLAQSVSEGPQPGDVFREHTFPQRLILCFRPSNPAQCNNVPAERSAGLTFDPAGATRAELAVEYWGGHIGTRQHVRVNAQDDWQPLPPIQNVPSGARQQCYFRTILGRTLPLDLSQLRNGENRFRFTISHNNQFGQDTSCPGSFGWGTTYIYGFTARLYYTPGSIPAPSGSITAPAENATIGEMPHITVQATPPAGRTIARVDVIGEYLDYDWDGNGVLREWQYQLVRTQMQRHIGWAVRDGNVYRVVWNTTWIPDQIDASGNPLPVRLMARITDSDGVSVMTAARTVWFQRVGRQVRMYTSSHDRGNPPQRVYGVPQNFGPRNMSNTTAPLTTTITVSDDPGNAASARMIIHTWAGDQTKEEPQVRDRITINGIPIVNVNASPPATATPPIGADHHWSFDWRDVPVSALSQGDNIFGVWTNRHGHHLEINWPGPALMVEWVDAPYAHDQVIVTPEDTPVTITLTGSTPFLNPLTIAPISNPSRGTLSGSGTIRTYTSQANYNGTDRFDFRVSSIDGEDIGTIYIVVTPVNDAPVLNPAPRTFPSIPEDVPNASNPGTTVSALLSGMVTDPDADALPAGMALTSASGNGTWQYSLNGSEWLDVGAVTPTSALLLEPSARLRFRPALNFFGQASITYRAWDRTDGFANGQRNVNPGNGGGTSAYSSATATATITVEPVNDPPELTIASNVMTTHVLAPFSVVGSSFDVEDETLTMTIDFGDGASAQTTASAPDRAFTFTYAYQRSGTYMVTVTARDSENATASVSFTVRVVNDPPTAGFDAGNPATAHIFTTYNGAGSFFDTENDNVSIQINAGDGTPEQSIPPAPDGVFTFSHQYRRSGVYTITLTVRDSEATTIATQTVNVINAPPVVAISGPGQARVDQALTGTGSFTDIEEVAASAWKATVDYGDGSGPQRLILSDDKRFVLNHTYAAEGTYTVTVRVTDIEGAVGTASVTVRVSRFFFTHIPLVVR